MEWNENKEKIGGEKKSQNYQKTRLERQLPGNGAILAARFSRGRKEYCPKIPRCTKDIYKETRKYNSNE